MWQFLLTKPEAEPLALGIYLFIFKPSLAQMEAIYKLSLSIPKLFVAFATADLISFATGAHAARLVLDKIANAKLTSLPLTKSMTKRAFLGVRRTFVAVALASVTAGLVSLTGSSTFLVLFVVFFALFGAKKIKESSKKYLKIIGINPSYFNVYRHCLSLAKIC